MHCYNLGESVVPCQNKITVAIRLVFPGCPRFQGLKFAHRAGSDGSMSTFGSAGPG